MCRPQWFFDQMQGMDQSDMRKDLQQLYAQDPEARLMQIVWRSLADPVKPEDANGRFRPHPLLVLLGILGAFAATVSLYFTYFKP
jgi:hypothetical protein